MRTQRVEMIERKDMSTRGEKRVEGRMKEAENTTALTANKPIVQLYAYTFMHTAVLSSK